MSYIIYSLEDDKEISRVINIILTKNGNEVVSFYDATSFFKAFDNIKPNMVLLDLMLPDMSGEDVLKRIRSDSSNKNIEIIVISAKNSIVSKVDMLDLGADDYISKPFEVLELISRVNAKKRRHEEDEVLKYKDLEIYPKKFEVKKNDKFISFTTNEFKILLYLLKNKDRVVSRDELFKAYWGTTREDNPYESRVIDVHVKAIRDKLSSNKDEYIITLYGEGYRLKNE